MPTSPPNAPSDTAALSDRLRTYLAEPRYAAIATLDANGDPFQAIVWYLPTNDGLVINSRRERHWPRNLLRDPRISIAVQDWAEPDHWVRLSGTAEFLHDGDAAYADIATMARRYNGDPEKYRGQDRVSYRVTVERTFEYGATDLPESGR
jgi:PPOX class probable F420-dependent enzyme